MFCHQTVNKSGEKTKIPSIIVKFPLVSGQSVVTSEQNMPPKPPRSENLRGCDWLQEVSITVRRFKRTKVPSDRFVVMPVEK